jgi:hypothetical protein
MRLAGIPFEELEQATAKNFAKSAGGNLGKIVSALIPYLFYGAGVLLLLYLIYGGYKLMLSGGDPKAVQQGKSIITMAFMGFAVVFASYWIVQIVGRFLGVDVFGTIF